MLKDINNAAHLEQWPASVQPPVCLISSSLAHIPAVFFFFLRRLTKQVPANAHGDVAGAVAGI